MLSRDIAGIGVTLLRLAYYRLSTRFSAVLVVLTILLISRSECWALSSPNVPLDSKVYEVLEKLSGLGLISGDIRGIRPYSRAEVARLFFECSANITTDPSLASPLAVSLLDDLKRLLPREISLTDEDVSSPTFDFHPVASARIRYAYLDGEPRDYNRPVHDPGGDGVFGIGSGLREDHPYPSIKMQHGHEGTPLIANNEGIVYPSGSSAHVQFTSEGYFGHNVSFLLEPLLLSREDDGTDISFGKAYVKFGWDPFEIQLGRDSNWLGPGYRGALTLTNNARNFDMLKISSPKPIYLKYVGSLKYVYIFSRFDQTSVNGVTRRPYFLAMKVSMKPTVNFEIGFNLGRQFGGPGVNNSAGNTVRGFVGGTFNDNSNSLAGIELRYRIPWLRYTEIYGEYSGEDAAKFWPFVESYIAGVFVPSLSRSGQDDLRIEYFWGNRILYSNETFPAGYTYRGMPIGHSQGGAAQEVFVRYSHWFSARHTLALEYIYGSRGNVGRVEVDANGNYSPTGTKQAVERRSGVRGFWNLPLHGDFNMQFMAGTERVHNVNLVQGVKRTNSIFTSEIQYRY